MADKVDSSSWFLTELQINAGVSLRTIIIWLVFLQLIALLEVLGQIWPLRTISKPIWPSATSKIRSLVDSNQDLAVHTWSRETLTRSSCLKICSSKRHNTPRQCKERRETLTKLRSKVAHTFNNRRNLCTWAKCIHCTSNRWCLTTREQDQDPKQLEQLVNNLTMQRYQIVAEGLLMASFTSLKSLAKSQLHQIKVKSNTDLPQLWEVPSKSLSSKIQHQSKILQGSILVFLREMIDFHQLEWSILIKTIAVKVSMVVTRAHQFEIAFCSLGATPRTMAPWIALDRSTLLSSSQSPVFLMTL